MNLPLNPRGKSYGVEHILAPRTASLGEVLQETLGLAPDRVDFLMEMGSIYLNSERLENSLKNMQIPEGAYLRVHQNPRRFPIDSVPWKDCVQEDNSEFLLINKPSGIPVHPTVDNTQENLLTLLTAHLGQQLFITSRLDVATSGLLCFAKNKNFQTHFNQMLAKNEVKKFYKAQVFAPASKEPELGEWVHYMEPSPKAPKVVSREHRPSWVLCRLKVHDCHRKDAEFCEVTVELLTGRTHQIRAQLGYEGHAIKGDASYGSPYSYLNERFAGAFECIDLQCVSLGFPDTSGAWRQFKLNESPWHSARSLSSVRILS